MKYANRHSRRAQFGTLSISLTVTLIAALVLLNAIFFTLAKRFSWYIDMTPERLYSVSELCHTLIDDALDEVEDQGQTPHVEIIFCEDTREYASGSSGSYILGTANELAARHPGVFEVRWFDCFEDVVQARELGVTNSSHVVIRTQNGQQRILHQREFFTFASGNTTSPIGYDGERVFATTLSFLLDESKPQACFTLNHDERFYDESVLYLLRDAGYSVSLIDLYYDDIPEDCTLLVCYNPSLDFIVADGVSEFSETDKVRRFLDEGNSMMVFLSATTPTLPNLEQLLGEYGVSVAREADPATGREYNCMVKDASVALSSDGFTIYGQYVESGAAKQMLGELTSLAYVPRVVFRDATVLSLSEGFAPGADGSAHRGSRVRHDLFVASPEAVAWSGGRQVSLPDDSLCMMTLTEDTQTGARLLCCASTEYAAQAYAQSAVFGNADVLLCAVREMGMEDVMLGLRYKPFASSSITSLTTVQTTRWTLALTLVPALCALAVGPIVLVRRKHS